MTVTRTYESEDGSCPRCCHQLEGADLAEAEGILGDPACRVRCPGCGVRLTLAVQLSVQVLTETVETVIE